jgi:CheY-like chemotaxis protein
MSLDFGKGRNDSVGRLEKLNLELPILVAEDNADDAFLLKHAFARAGFGSPVRFVADGEQVLLYLEGEGEYANRAQYPFPALLLLDIKMPRLDGLEVLTLIRNDPRFRRLIVIMLTSSSREQDVNRAFDLQANSYLVKPARPEAMPEVLGQIRGYWLGLNHFPRCPAS